MFEDQDDTCVTTESSVARLCETYDALLEADDEGAAAEPGADLSALARIYDIPTDRPAGEVWGDLRAFLVRQPARAGTGDDEIERPSPEPGDARLTILVVEDDPDMAEDLVAALTDAGHSVIGPFHSAEAAEAAAAHQPIDLALLDINLSGDVTSAARHARSAHAILVKPYRTRDILQAVARAATAM